MYKPVIVANKSWWVPKRDGLKLAVQIDNPEEYRQAVLWKMETLTSKAGLEKAAKLADRVMRQEGALSLDRTYNPEHLVQQVMENSLRVALMVKEGDPARATAADPAKAKALVEAQAELTWGDFLT